MQNYLVNLIKLLRGDRVLRPLITTFYVTTRCNLNCTYCEDFGARRNSQAEAELDLADALRVLRIIRGGTDSLILTGGEPLLYPEIDALVHRARRELGFKHITMLSNGLLLAQHETLLRELDRLVISLDSTDAELWSEIIAVAPETAHTILENVRFYARKQRAYDFQMVVNCVLTPETLPGAPALLDFCAEHDILVSFSPQAVHNWPHYDLLVSVEYKRFLRALIDQKRRGAPVLGSMAYLRGLLDFAPYSCYPTLVPRVMPNGDLIYPCRPIEKEAGSHGGRPCNLLKVDSWASAMEIAESDYGAPPQICTSCFQQCFAEPSLMQARPVQLFQELLFYSPSRRGEVWKYAPG